MFPRCSTFKGVLLNYESSVKSIFLRELLSPITTAGGAACAGAGGGGKRPPAKRRGGGASAAADGAAEAEVIELESSDDEASGGGGGEAGSGAGAAARETCTVEQLALDYYAREGWRGVHSEGSAVRTLFGLVMFDILFDPSAALGAFRTPFQTAPLDLGTPFFLPARCGRF